MEIRKLTKLVFLRDKNDGFIYHYIQGTEKDDIYDMVVKIIVTASVDRIKKSDLLIFSNEPYDESKVRDFIDRVNKMLEVLLLSIHALKKLYRAYQAHIAVE